MTAASVAPRDNKLSFKASAPHAENFKNFEFVVHSKVKRTSATLICSLHNLVQSSINCNYFWKFRKPMFIIIFRTRLLTLTSPMWQLTLTVMFTSQHQTSSSQNPTLWLMWNTQALTTLRPAGIQNSKNITKYILISPTTYELVFNKIWWVIIDK